MGGRERQEHKPEEEFGHQVGKKEARKLEARGRPKQSLWFELGMFGVIGWSVALPTLIGVALGLWLDRKWPGPISWTLTLMFVGLALGCLNAWFWVRTQRRLMEKKKKKGR